MGIFDFLFPKKHEAKPMPIIMKNPYYDRAEALEKINRKYWFNFRIERNLRRRKHFLHQWQPLKMYSPSDGMSYWLEKPKGEQDCD